ncbi:glutamate/tyrosine decarboxylase-like PLP-dependent enzyme [Kribbella amoyensis]|uniref:Glutamate/tyrosine decarboxylase-like PLP-dependent enzyme n=1 Tax=Kribbella amoyensis TaxID=996641 RepID=A0A561BRG6_9ACTN|nr:pyridoxal-dependent decarboxylase [Kribbella amoyensis]TWD81488.1 glutamate/tyrosine decarboxylase-like PLP-dependent enzyme [Kribbella amoyensis]
MHPTDLRKLFADAAGHAAMYRQSLSERRVRSPKPFSEVGADFRRPLGDAPRPADEVVDELVALAEGGIVASAGPRYFGFVTGGALPAATAAEILAAGWDQNAMSSILSPAAAAAEQAAADWLKDLLGLPSTASAGFVTGAQGANTVALAAARNHVLAQAGWDVETDGLMGAPRVRILAGDERHATIDRSLRLLGFGSGCLELIRTTANGVIDLDDLRGRLAGQTGPLIVCLQAGNVNTGHSDALGPAAEIVHEYDGWVHVDGAFGMWAALSPELRDQVAGLELADSWGCDGHKWLNLPYDNGFVFTAHPDAHASALAYTASYLVSSGEREPGDYAMESSRRARGLAAWAGLQELGRDGLREVVDRCCVLARRFAEQLAAAGCEIGNDVVLNQVLVSYGDDAETDAVIADVQRAGVCWMGGTTWRGRRYMRISVSNHLTTERDVDQSVESILAARSMLPQTTTGRRPAERAPSSAGPE